MSFPAAVYFPLRELDTLDCTSVLLSFFVLAKPNLQCVPPASSNHSASLHNALCASCCIVAPHCALCITATAMGLAGALLPLSGAAVESTDSAVTLCCYLLATAAAEWLQCLERGPPLLRV